MTALVVSFVFSMVQGLAIGLLWRRQRDLKKLVAELEVPTTQVPPAPLDGHPYRTAAALPEPSARPPRDKVRLLMPQAKCPRCGGRPRVMTRCTACSEYDAASHYHVECRSSGMPGCGAEWLERPPDVIYDSERDWGG